MGSATKLHEPQPKQTFLAFTLTLFLFGIVGYISLFPPSLIFVRRLHRRVPKPFFTLLGRLSHLFQPFLRPLQAPSDLAIAVRSFSDYSFAQQKAVDAKWRAFERMPKRHRRWGDKLGWRRKLGEVEDRIEVNARVTDELATLGMALARKEGVPLGLRSKFWRQDGRVVEVSPYYSTLCVSRAS